MERIICLLMAFVLSLCAEDEFIFFAQLSNKNLILVYQNENVSLAMTQTQNTNEEFACELAYEPEDLNYLEKTKLGLINEAMPKALKLRFLNKHKSKLLECFSKAEVKVNDKIQSEFMQIQNMTFITILPLRFRVNFANDKALIYELVKR